MRKFAKTSLLVIFLSCTLSAQLFELDDARTDADQMPYFPGCENYENNTEVKRQCSNKELIAYVSNYLIYPNDAREKGIEGKVYVSFVVDETGVVIAPKVLFDIGGGCGDAALQVVKDMPKWEPAIHEGKKVKVKLNMPIHFAMRVEEQDLSENYKLSWGANNDDTISNETLRDNLSHPIYVRNMNGDNLVVDELSFTYQKKNRFLNAKSRGQYTEAMKKVIQKSRKGGLFMITASVQEKGNFITVSRTFEIVE